MGDNGVGFSNRAVVGPKANGNAPERRLRIRRAMIVTFTAEAGRCGGEECSSKVAFTAPERADCVDDS
jgi:hypothetical protein